ncbi:tripartite tricarboxylate transporter substrate binding protein [Variovorax sp. V35]|uniref:Bug family tripartite tricarboxylate transporter substrate binding protein n=2 Tax=Variovorax TaxID=34072 RepID=UPI0032E7B3E9
MSMNVSPRPPLRRRQFNLGLGLAMAAPATWAKSEDYPQKPLRWVVGFPAGGGTDVLARTVGAQLSAQMGQTVYVENKTGAGGTLAAEHVAASASDGHTLLTGDVAIMVFNRVLYPQVRYEPLRDFAPVGLMARFPLVIATHPNSGIGALEQFTAAARRGQASYASAGVGTPHHLAMELLLSRAGLSAVHVPYRGDAPALQDLLGGMVPVAVLAPSLSLPYVRSQKLQALAVTSERRLPQLPEVPTLAELRLVSEGVYAWQGLVVPKKTPAGALQRLSRELGAALSQAPVRSKLEELGMEVTPSDGPTLQAHVHAEQARWDPMIRSRGIKAD